MLRTPSRLRNQALEAAALAWRTPGATAKKKTAAGPFGFAAASYEPSAGQNS
jgi:hypothetical protein